MGSVQKGQSRLLRDKFRLRKIDILDKLAIWLAILGLSLCLALTLGWDALVGSSSDIRWRLDFRNLVKRGPQDEYIRMFVSSKLTGPNQLNSLYHTSVTLGAGVPQKLNLAIGLDDFTWVPTPYPDSSTFCGSTNQFQREACSIAGLSQFFNPTRSSSFREEPREGRMPGDDQDHVNIRLYGRDDITIDDVTITDFLIGVSDMWSRPPSLGLGLGLETLTTNERNISDEGYINSLYQRNLIASRTAAFYLRDDMDGKNGSIILGGVDKQRFFGKLQILPVDSKNQEFGAVDVQNVSSEPWGSFSNRNVTTPNASFYPDLAVIGVPNAVFKRFKALPNITSKVQTGSPERLYIHPSNIETLEEVKIDFEFGNVSIALRAKDCVICVESDGLCELVIVDTKRLFPGANLSYALGVPFFRSAYVVYDRDSREIGIAPLNPSPEKEEIIHIGQYTVTLAEVMGVVLNPSIDERPVSAGLVAGTVLGVLFSLLLAAFGIWYYRRRRQDHLNHIPDPPIPSYDPHQGPVEMQGIRTSVTESDLEKSIEVHHIDDDTTKSNSIQTTIFELAEPKSAYSPTLKSNYLLPFAAELAQFGSSTRRYSVTSADLESIDMPIISLPVPTEAKPSPISPRSSSELLERRLSRGDKYIINA